MSDSGRTMFKGNADLPVHGATSPLRRENGRVRCPGGIGFGVEAAPALVVAALVVAAHVVNPA